MLTRRRDRRDGIPARTPAPSGRADLSAVHLAAPSPAIASVLVIVVFLGYLLMQMVNVLSAPLGTWQLVACLAVPPVLIVLQYIHSAPRAEALRRRLSPWTLLLQGLLTFVPLVAFGWHWGGMVGFLAGSLLLILPAPVNWLLYAATIAAVIAISVDQHMDPVDVAYMGVSGGLTGLVLYALARLAKVATAIHESRDELARMAVARERLRFARDLHDLLGYSLSSITLKNELIARLIEPNPQRAREEVAEVLAIARQALADVREVARGYRDMSLLVEADSAASVLKAAGIEARLDVHTAGLSSTANTILATVLREGVTNLLRHSQPRTCAITTRGGADSEFAELEITNDGVGEGSFVPAGSVPSGTGLGNLAARVAAVGGRLEAGTVKPGTFRLLVRVPAGAAAPAHDPLTGHGTESRAEESAVTA